MWVDAGMDAGKEELYLCAEEPRYRRFHVGGAVCDRDEKLVDGRRVGSPRDVSEVPARVVAAEDEVREQGLVPASLAGDQSICCVARRRVAEAAVRLSALSKAVMPILTRQSPNRGAELRRREGSPAFSSRLLRDRRTELQGDSRRSRRCCRPRRRRRSIDRSTVRTRSCTTTCSALATRRRGSRARCSSSGTARAFTSSAMRCVSRTRRGRRRTEHSAERLACHEC